MYENEPPLNRRELKIVRGMIDDYEYRRIHEQERDEWWSSTKVVIVSFAAIAALSIQFATFIVLLSHG